MLSGKEARVGMVDVGGTGILKWSRRDTIRSERRSEVPVVLRVFL